MAKIFKKSPLKSSRIARKKRKILIAKCLCGSAVIGLFVYGVAWLSRIEPLRINTVIVKGNSGVDTKSLEQIARSQIAGSYFFILSKSNKLLYPKDMIQAQVLASSARIENATVDIEDNNALTISIVEREPTSVWCSGEQGSQTKKCYLIDADGYIFAEAPTFSSNPFFELYGGNVTGEAIGNRFIAPARFHELTDFIAHLKTINLNSIALSLTNETYSLYLEHGGSILFNKDANMQNLAQSLSAIAEHTDILKEKRDRLEYLDLRFGNRIFYKMIGDNAESEAEE